MADILRAFEVCNVNRKQLATGLIGFSRASKVLIHLVDSIGSINQRNHERELRRFVCELVETDCDVKSLENIFGELMQGNAFHIHLLPHVMIAFARKEFGDADLELVRRKMDVEPQLAVKHRKRSHHGNSSASASLPVLAPPTPATTIQTCVPFDEAGHARYAGYSHPEMVDMCLQLTSAKEEGKRKLAQSRRATAKVETALVVAHEKNTREAR